MSYVSENVLARGAKLADVREFVQLLGYKKVGTVNSKKHGRWEEYKYFEEEDYRSWSGVHLSIVIKPKSLVVDTRTPIGRSYYDLQQQNRTIFQLRKRFGGHFQTDEGRGRYLRPMAGPPTPGASGCHLAYERFGGNLIRGAIYLEARSFPEQYQGKSGELLVQMGVSPLLLSNNMFLPFIVAALEDYFKSTFIALLRYSPRKSTFFRGSRLQGDQLIAISEGKSVEAQVAETLPFQNISAITRHFEALDPKIDIGGLLRKPYRRRKETLYQQMERIVATRHNFIHRAQLDRSLTDKKMMDLLYDLDVAITRIYKGITSRYDWDFERGWYLGNRTAKTETVKQDTAGASVLAPST
jgi:hypothetical protein